MYSAQRENRGEKASYRLLASRVHNVSASYVQGLPQVDGWTDHRIRQVAMITPAIFSSGVFPQHATQRGRFCVKDTMVDSCPGGCQPVYSCTHISADVLQKADVVTQECKRGLP